MAGECVMGELLPLRDYQRACIDAVRTDWVDNAIRRTAVVLPTGAGKTVVIAHKIKEWRDQFGSRVMVLVHRDELAHQTVNKLRAIAPHLSVGIVKGAKREINRDVIVVSVQSLRTEAARNKITHVGLIIVDECHHATAKTYRDILEHYGCFDGGLVTDQQVLNGAIAVGFTATLARGDDANLGEIWQKVSYRKDILWMIRRGYLLDVYAKRVEVDDLSFANVRSRGGDYQEGDLGTALMESLAPEVTAAAYREHATYTDADGVEQLRSGVGFAPTVESAGAFCDAFNDLGIKSEIVTGMTPADERRAIFSRCHDGTTTVLWNCGVATEGTDVPVWSCAVIARPTKSSPLYQQMVGRVLRPHPGQGVGQPITKALVLDVVGVTRRHQLRSLVDLTGRTFREEVEADASLIELDDLETVWEEEETARVGHDLSWEYAEGPTRTVEVDLFASSRQQWLQTDGGVWFVNAGKEAFVFLAPSAVEPGTFDVMWCRKYPARNVKNGGVTEHVNVPLEIAMAWGEDTASEYPDYELFSDKERAWRKSKPTEKTINYARKLGLTFAADIKANELSNMIAHAEATARIDTIVQKMGRG